MFTIIPNKNSKVNSVELLNINDGKNIIEINPKIISTNLNVIVLSKSVTVDFE